MILLVARELAGSVLLQRVSRLLALDQASRTTGWSVFIDGKLEKWGHFTLESDDVGERLFAFRTILKEKIAEFDINEIAFEDIQLQDNVKNNVATFKTLAEFFGCVYELATEMKIPNTAVLASTWKSTLGITGKDRPTQKRNAQTFAQEKYQIKCTQDEADSICIGTHMIIHQGYEKKPTKKTNVPVEGFSWD